MATVQPPGPPVEPVGLIQLDRSRTFRADFNTFVRLEEGLGLTFGASLDVRDLLASARRVRYVLWAGLVDEDPTLTEEQVGRYLSLANFAEVARRMLEIITQAMPEAGDGDGEGSPDPPPPPPADGTG